LRFEVASANPEFKSQYHQKVKEKKKKEKKKTRQTWHQIETFSFKSATSFQICH
jgi:hypothetical protein